MKPSTTKMSSKGQVVIPEEIRNRLRLEPGTQFVVVGSRDVVILKKLNAPSLSDFEELVSETHRQASCAGMTRTSVPKAVRSARGKH